MRCLYAIFRLRVKANPVADVNLLPVAIQSEAEPFGGNTAHPLRQPSTAAERSDGYCAAAPGDDPIPADAVSVPSISPIVRPLVSIPINQIAAAPTRYQNAK